MASAILIFSSSSTFSDAKFKPVAQRQEMVIGTLALPYSLLDGSCYVSRAVAPKGGQSPVEYRGNLFIPSVCPSVRTYISPPPPPRGPSEADSGLSWAGPGLSEAGPGLSEIGPGLPEASQSLS